MNRNYKTISQIELSREALRQWADSTQCDEVVALAIHAISDSNRTPNMIWENPTRAEEDHVNMAITEYLAHGDYPAREDGKYMWGLCEIDLIHTSFDEAGKTGRADRAWDTAQ